MQMHALGVGRIAAPRLSRREVIRVGCLGLTGLTLSRFFELRASAAATAPAVAADAVILLMLEGGLSHLDSFDPKPGAAIEVRGEFGTISTKVEGLQLSGLWGQTASVAESLAVIRSVTHTESAHDRAAHLMLTGHLPVPPLQYPSMGAVLAHEAGPRHDVPAHWILPSAGAVYAQAGAGYLAPLYGGFSVRSAPAEGGFTVGELLSPRGTPAAVPQTQTAPEGSGTSAAASRPGEALTEFDCRAHELLTSPAAREAFDLSSEPDALRNTYGRTHIGQWLLTSRRLIQAGARFVTVSHPGWDMHIDLQSRMRTLVPPLDSALAALIRDLRERGLLQRTLVIVATEFGRSPRMNRDRGREHWPAVFSIAMAGGGIRGGQVLGSSSADGAEPKDQPVRPSDIAATVYAQLGIDPKKKLDAASDHPTEIIRDGAPIRQLV